MCWNTRAWQGAAGREVQLEVEAEPESLEHRQKGVQGSGPGTGLDVDPAPRAAASSLQGWGPLIQPCNPVQPTQKEQTPRLGPVRLRAAATPVLFLQDPPASSFSFRFQGVGQGIRVSCTHLTAIRILIPIQNPCSLSNAEASLKGQEVADGAFSTLGLQLTAAVPLPPTLRASLQGAGKRWTFCAHPSCPALSP